MARRGSLTLRERQALRRGEKVYRNGISVDRRGNPIPGDKDEQGRDRSQWGISGSNIDRHGNPIDPSSPDYIPNFDDDVPADDVPADKIPDKSLITGGSGADADADADADDGADYDQGSVVHTAMGQNEIGQDMMQTDTYGISGDESTKVTTFSTHFEGVDYAGLSEYELSKFNQAGNEGWIYKTHQRGEGEVGYVGDLVRDKIRIKVNKYGTPWTDPNAGKYPTGTGADDEDPDANTLTSDDEGRFPGEPGYGKGPDWEPPFQTSGGETDMPTDAEIDFMMDDANYDTGGNLNETNTETGANISTFEIGLGYGNVGGWEPTKRPVKDRGKGQYQAEGASAETGNLRRKIQQKRNLSPSLISGPR